MPPADDVFRQLKGAWQMMTGRPDGLRLLDLSSDGFWTSFFAIVVAAPPLLAGWVSLVAELAGADTRFGNRLSMLLRLGVADLGVWVLPFVALAAIASYAGLRQRFVHYVVAINWGSALFAWMTLPASLVLLFFPGASDLAAMLSLLVFIVTLVLYWRLTAAALQKGPMTATVVFVFMLAVSLMTLFALHDILRIGSLQ